MPRDTSAPAWFRQHFNEDYRVLYAGRTHEQADAEVAFAVERLALEERDWILDLCCGHGRHLGAFARRGLRAVGVDLSPSLLRQVPDDDLTAVVCADMRHLPFATAAEGSGGGEPQEWEPAAEPDEPPQDQPRDGASRPGRSSRAGRGRRGAVGRGFSALVNFFTSFGYFEDDRENAVAAREMARVLRPGGRFLVDLMNPAKVIRDLVPATERVAGPFEVQERRWFDEDRRRVEKRIHLLDRRDGSRREYFESVRVYEDAEIRALLDAAGLRVEHIYGDLLGGPPTPDSPRLVAVGRRCGGTVRGDR